jgi:PPOX class probable F420-dependent enzyme
MTTIHDPKVQEILNGRRIATMATHNGDGSVHLTAVWYLLDQASLYVETSSQSRKGRNLKERPRASLMVDVRQPGRERGVSISGAVEVVSGAQANDIKLRVHRRYMSEAAVQDPNLGRKLAAMDDLTIRLRPERVFAWDLTELDKAFFGGRFGAPGAVLALDV